MTVVLPRHYRGKDGIKSAGETKLFLPLLIPSIYVLFYFYFVVENGRSRTAETCCPSAEALATGSTYQMAKAFTENEILFRVNEPKRLPRRERLESDSHIDPGIQRHPKLPCPLLGSIPRVRIGPVTI